MSDTRTFRDAVAQYFKARPNTWIDGMTLRDVGGCYAWRTRVSEVRRQLGLNIVNRVRRLESGVAVSEYMYVPAKNPEQVEMFL
jgi:hypothetical protein